MGIGGSLLRSLTIIVGLLAILLRYFHLHSQRLPMIRITL